MYIILACAILFAAAAAVLAEAWRRERIHRRAVAAEARTLGADLRNVLDNLSSGLVMVDMRGVIQRMNPAAEAILQLDEAEALHRPITDVFESGLHGFTSVLAHVLAGGEPVLRREVSIDRGDGRALPVGVSATPVRDRDGDLTGTVAVFQDLTEINAMRAKLREADQLAAVGELSAGIAHEIRNPLGSIRGSVEILAAELSPEGEERKLMDLILKESRRVNDIITEFLSFARTRPAKPRLVELRPFLTDVARQVCVHVREHGGAVEVTETVDPDDMLIQMDPEQMQQVLLNLSMNALEAMDYTGRLDLVADLDDLNTACRIVVIDTGPGVPQESRADLFKPFFTGRKGGTGLGLSVVKRIVHDHGGHVELSTPPDGGSAFAVVLPLCRESRYCVEPETACLIGG